MKNQQILEAQTRIANGTLQARGYRLLIKPIEANRALEAAQMEKFPTLAAAGLQAKSDGQAEKETQGTNYGVVVDIGPEAYKQMRNDKDQSRWCEVGDIVIFRRYEGAKIEYPPGSGVEYTFINDEDVFGAIK